MSSTGSFDISCAHFKKCSGCVYESIASPPEVFISASSLFKEFGVDLPLIKGNQKGWRLRAKLAVRKNKETGSIEVGLFEKGSHAVVEIPNCQVRHPRIN